MQRVFYITELLTITWATLLLHNNQLLLTLQCSIQQ